MLTGRGTVVDVVAGFGVRRAGAIDRPMEIADGVFIEPLSGRDQAILRQACHITRFEPQELPSDAYALVDVEPRLSNWDHRHRLWRGVNYSRLAWPNLMSREFAAQVSVAVDGSLSPAHIPEVPPFLARAYLAPGRAPRVPTVQDVEVLRQVLRSPASNAKPSRLGRAMWRYTNACFIYYANFWANTLIGSIETLVNTQRKLAKEQFVSRVAGLSRLCFGDRRYGRTWARRVYSMRNTLAHGRRLVHHRRGYTPEGFERAYETLLAELEEFVRSVLVAGFTRADVRNVLQSPRRTAARWPV